MKVLRISHSAVVDAWRDRERELRRQGVTVRLLSAKVWNEFGVMVPLEPRDGEDVVGVRTFGQHPALFVYDPLALWRALGEDWDVLDMHEEPFALCTAEILVIRWLRGLLRGRPYRAPFVMYSAQNIYKRYPFPFGWFERRILRRAAGIYVCNVDAGRNARMKGLGGEVAFIPLGIDPRQFSPAVEGDDRASAGGPIRVGYAGRLESHKGVDVLLDAVAGDDRLHLDIAGNGPCRAALESRAADLNGRVRFLGALAGKDLPAFYRSVQVLAVPSLETPGWIEQFGRVALEAMACGTPVVASDSGALPDVVGTAGILVPPGDPEALRAALRRVGDNPELAERLRQQGYAFAATCTWEAVASRYRELYQRITERAGQNRISTRPVARPDHAAAEPPEVLLVAYGSPSMVREALIPLAGHLPITVVDNSSLAAIRDVTEQLGGRYVDAGTNRGFASGVNLGLRHRQAPGRDLLLLNPDAVVGVEGVRQLQAALHREPGIASVGPSQVDGDGRPSRVAWPFPHPGGTWAEAFGFGRLRRRDDFVIGSVLLINAVALRDVGDLDERFFLYAEETDWALRAARMGWRHRAVPTVTAVHVGAGTSSDPVRREVHFHASQERFYRKHFGRTGWQINRVGAMAGAAARGVLRRGESGAADRRRFRLYLRGPVQVENTVRTAGG